MLSLTLTSLEVPEYRARVGSEGIASKTFSQICAPSCFCTTSEEIAELLYIAYNRDDSEILQFSKALDAQYDALYSSGKDILQKRQEKLDEEINRKAIELATDSIVKADKYKQIEAMKEEQKVKERANELIDQYKDQLDEVTYNGAKEEVKKAKVRTTRKRKTKEEEAE